MHSKNLLTDEVLAELARSGYVSVIVRFVSQFFSLELDAIASTLESSRASYVESSRFQSSRMEGVEEGAESVDQSARISVDSSQPSHPPAFLRAVAEPSSPPPARPAQGEGEEGGWEEESNLPLPLNPEGLLQRQQQQSLDRALKRESIGESTARLPPLAEMMPPVTSTQSTNINLTLTPGVSFGVRPIKDVEAVIMCLSNLATKLLDVDLLHAFNGIAPILFDKFLAPHSPL
ncbi:MAG: hypothetical protein SGPRY_001753, partial [Prymnesium sp.]